MSLLNENMKRFKPPLLHRCSLLVPIALFISLLIICALPASCGTHKSPIFNSASLSTYSFWIDSILGDDSNNGSLEAPFKTLERAISNLTLQAPNSYILNLSPGNYTLQNWHTASMIVRVQSCQLCPGKATSNYLDSTNNHPSSQRNITNEKTTEWINSDMNIHEKTVIGANPNITITLINFEADAHSITFLDSHIELQDILFKPASESSNRRSFYQRLIDIRTSHVSFYNVAFDKFVLKRYTPDYCAIISSTSSNVTLNYVTLSHIRLNTTRYHRAPGVTSDTALFLFHASDRVVMSNSLALNNTIIADTVFGGIIATLGPLTVERSAFRNNFVWSFFLSMGGVLGAAMKTEVNVSDCEFTNNIASTIKSSDMFTAVGGAIYVSPDSQLTVTRSHFYLNSAIVGGAIGISQITPSRTGFIMIEDCVFAYNYASSLGAAIYASAAHSATLIVQKSTFIANMVPATSVDSGYVSPSAIFAADIRDELVLSDLTFLQRPPTITHNVSTATVADEHEPSKKERNLLKSESIFTTSLFQQLPLSGTDVSLQFKVTHRIACGRMPLVEFRNINYENIMLESSDGALMYLQDIIRVSIVSINFKGVMETSRNDFSHITKSIILVDADSELFTEGSYVEIHNIFVGPLDIVSPFPLIHIRNTDWAQLNHIELNGFSTSPEQGAIFIHSVRQVILQDITYISSAAQLTLQDIGDCFIYDSSFSFMKNYLPVVDASSLLRFTLSNVSFSDLLTTALHIVDTRSVSISKSRFERCVSDGNDGGAIFLSGPVSVTIQQSNFIDCSAANGGAIFAWESVVVQNCLFSQNQASLAGGAIYTSQENTHIFASNFEFNTAPTGGAIFAQDLNAIIAHSNFTGNTATQDRGGAIQVATRASLFLTTGLLLNENRFVNNHARLAGGALSVDNDTFQRIINSFFANNTAGPKEILGINTYLLPDYQPLFGFGGAIYTRGPLSIYRSTFESNFAKSGAAIYLEWHKMETVYLDMSSCLFDSNEAAHTGGAITFNTLNIVEAFRLKNIPFPSQLANTAIINTTFTNNTAFYYGGAIAYTGFNANLTCGGNLFIENMARYGGIFYSDAFVPPLKVQSHLFIDNRALGGALIFMARSNYSSSTPSINNICSHWNSCHGNQATGWGPLYASASFGIFWVIPVPFQPAYLPPPTVTLPWPVPNISMTCTQPQPPTHIGMNILEPAFAEEDLLLLSSPATAINHLKNTWGIDLQASQRRRAYSSTHSDEFLKTEENNGKAPDSDYSNDEAYKEYAEHENHPRHQSSYESIHYQNEQEAGDFRKHSIEGLFGDTSELFSIDMPHDNQMRTIENYRSTFNEKLSSLLLQAADSSAPIPSDVLPWKSGQDAMSREPSFYPKNEKVMERLQDAQRDEPAPPPFNIDIDHVTTVYGPLTVHSGIDYHITLYGIDQFNQMLADDRVFPLTLSIEADDQQCPDPNYCGNVTLVSAGNAPIMSNGSIILEINLVLDEFMNPWQPTDVNISLQFSNVAFDSSLQWLAALKLTLMFQLDKCPIGYGFTGQGKPFCQICPFSTFNLNGDGHCRSCSHEPNLQCNRDRLWADDDYWIYKNPSTNEASAYLCPTGYCRGKNDTCALHRTGRLCAACEPGYSESLLPTCTKCNEPNWPLIFVALMCIWITVLVIHTIIAASSGKSTILFYFVQTASIFASDVPFPSSDKSIHLQESNICLLPLNPLLRRALISLLPVIMLVQILITFGLHYIFVNFIRPLLPAKYQCGSLATLQDVDDLIQTSRPALKRSMLEAADKTPLLDDDSLAEEKDGEASSGGAIVTSILRSPPQFSPKKRSKFDTAFENQVQAQEPLKSHYDSVSSLGSAASDDSADEVNYANAYEDANMEGDSQYDNQKQQKKTNERKKRRQPPSPTSSASNKSSSTGSPDSDLILMERDTSKNKMVILGAHGLPNQLISGESSDSEVVSDTYLSADEDMYDYRNALRDPFDEAIDVASSDNITVPAFGFELTDDEEEPLDAELSEWKLIPQDPVEYEGYTAKHLQGNPMGPTSNAVSPLPTLGALRKWMYEKRFFHHYRLIRTVLALMVFFYSSTSQLAFTLADCVHIRGGGPVFLKAYPTMLCDAAEYRPWLLSLIGIVPLLVAIFIYICVKLFIGYQKGELNQADVRYGIWYEMYKSNFFFWRIIELIRRSVLTAFSVFLNDFPLTRGIALSTSCFIILVVQTLAWPYRRQLENSLETMSTFVLAVISITCIWHAKDNPRVPAIIIWTLIIATTCLIFIAFTISIVRRRAPPLIRKGIEWLHQSNTPLAHHSPPLASKKAKDTLSVPSMRLN